MKKVKKFIEKKVIGILSFITMLSLSCTKVSAEPSWNDGGFRNLISSWIDPMTNTALWVVPLAGILACFVHCICWFGKDEDYKEQKPLPKIVKKYVAYTILVELIPSVYKLLNL